VHLSNLQLSNYFTIGILMKLQIFHAQHICALCAKDMPNPLISGVFQGSKFFWIGQFVLCPSGTGEFDSIWAPFLCIPCRDVIVCVGRRCSSLHNEGRGTFGTPSHLTMGFSASKNFGPCLHHGHAHVWPVMARLDRLKLHWGD
jgi:hypothetical protein